MSLSIKNNSPSFNGIVKLRTVFLDNVLSTDKKVIDSATRGLKAVLVKEPDNKGLELNYEVFKKIYGYFDKDYARLSIPSYGDNRHVFAKVRTGKDVFLVSGSDAADVAVSGRNIGGKRALERDYYSRNVAGSARRATEDYHSMKSEIAARYLTNPLQPTITLYAQKDKKGIVRLVAARMENAQNQIDRNPSSLTQTIRFDRPMVKKPVQSASVEAEKVVSKPVVEKTPKDVNPNSTVKKELTQSVFDFNATRTVDEKNSLLEDLHSKSWDTPLNKKSKKRKRKPKIDERQDNFLGELFKDLFDKKRID